MTDIRKDEFPENADIVLLAAPTTDLNQAQTEKLDRFLTEGAGNRTLLLFSSSLMPEMPRLNALLNEYGISLTQDIVYEGDPSQTISRQMSAFTAQMTEGEYTSGLLDRLHYPAVVNAVALRVLFDDKGSTGVSTVLTSSADGYVCSAQKAFDKADYSEADKDTRVLMAAASSFRSTMDGGEQRTDVIVAPDSLYAPEYFNSDIYGNLSLLMNVCNQRSGLDGSTVDIEPKSLYSVDFTADMRTLSVLNLVFGYVVPLAVLCAGAVVYFRRRRL